MVMVTAHVCGCISLCTVTVVYNTAQNSSDNLLSNFQANITAPIQSIGKEGENTVSKQCKKESKEKE